MKYVVVLILLMNSALAQNGPKPSSAQKRVSICCGKSTNITTAPSSVNPQPKTKSATVKPN